MCHCGAVVKELLALFADQLGSTAGDRDAVFCFLVVPFFLCLVSVFNTIFPFGLFSFILTSDPAGHALGSSIKLKSGVVSWERDFKSS